MTDRSDIERIVKDAYSARMAGDIEALTRVFSKNATFRIAGSHSASPIPVTAASPREFKAVVQEMITVFQWLDHEILELVIDGSKAAVHWCGKIRSTATGETVETELVDIFKIENGSVASLVEFCDTALAGRLMGASPQL
jgi:ketosteroid isomerase-like protein